MEHVKSDEIRRFNTKEEAKEIADSMTRSHGNKHEYQAELYNDVWVVAILVNGMFWGYLEA